MSDGTSQRPRIWTVSTDKPLRKRFDELFISQDLTSTKIRRYVYVKHANWLSPSQRREAPFLTLGARVQY